MLSTIDAALTLVDADRVVAFASELVAAGAPDDLEGPRASVVERLLQHPRIEVHVDPVLPGRPNVIARLRGRGDGPGLLLNGHLDGIAHEGGWTDDPLVPRIEGGRLIGGVVTDMLGGVASMMETMRAAAELDPLPGDLVLLANMYHDSNGVGTKYAMATDDPWPDFAINGEPTAMSILTAHGGCIKFQVTFRGRSAHVSRADEGADALAAAVAAYRALREHGFRHEPEERLPGLPILQLGVLQAGWQAALVADAAVIRGDVRTVPGMDWASCRADIERVLHDVRVPDVTTKVDCLVRQHPFLGPRAGVVVGALQAGHRSVLGVEASVDVDAAAMRFVTDASDLSRRGLETAVYGPGTWRYVPDEGIEIAEMVAASKVYLATACHLMATT
jgi:succinyl-diaminopimelate desuccinylase